MLAYGARIYIADFHPRCERHALVNQPPQHASEGSLYLFAIHRGDDLARLHAVADGLARMQPPGAG